MRSAVQDVPQLDCCGLQLRSVAGQQQGPVAL